MRDFFKSWRRKAGCVTLLMACVVCTEWVRSLAIIDLVNYSNRGTGYRAESVDGRIELRIDSLTKIGMPSGVESKPLEKRRLVDEQIAKRIKAAKRRLEALQHAKASLPPVQFKDLETRVVRSLRELEATLPTYAIPYWSIVLPLTLLSAYLLLSKPRQTAPKQSSEPAPTTGT